MASSSTSTTTETVALVPTDAVKNSNHDALRRFITSIGRFSAQADFKSLTGYCDENERLLGELDTKKTELTEHKNVNLRYAKDILSLQETAEENKETILQLRTQVTELEKTVQELKATTEKQKEVIVKASRKVKSQENLIKAKDEEIEKLKEKLGNERQKSSQLQEDLNSANDSKTAIERQHEAVATRLAEIEGFTIQLHQAQPDNITEKMATLWADASQLVHLYFNVDYPDELLQNRKMWEKLSDPLHFHHPVQIPKSNSIYAKQMRISIILAIIARSIDRFIFQPLYLFGEESGFRETLLPLAVLNSEKESFTRGLLLSLAPEEQEAMVREIIEKVVEEVASHVKDVLSKSHMVEFVSALEQLAQSACDTWVYIRATQTKYEPNFELVQTAGFEWDTLQYGDGAATNNGDKRTSTHGERDDELLVVFPRLYVIENNKEPRPVTHGTVLRRSQALPAAQEVERQMSSPTFGRIPSRRQRSRGSSIMGLPSSASRQGNGVAESFLGEHRNE